MAAMSDIIANPMAHGACPQTTNVQVCTQRVYHDPPRRAQLFSHKHRTVLTSPLNQTLIPSTTAMRRQVHTDLCAMRRNVPKKTPFKFQRFGAEVHTMTQDELLTIGEAYPNGPKEGQVKAFQQEQPNWDPVPLDKNAHNYALTCRRTNIVVWHHVLSASPNYKHVAATHSPREATLAVILYMLYCSRTVPTLSTRAHAAHIRQKITEEFPALKDIRVPTPRVLITLVPSKPDKPRGPHLGEPPPNRPPLPQTTGLHLKRRHLMITQACKQAHEILQATTTLHIPHRTHGGRKRGVKAPGCASSTRRRQGHSLPFRNSKHERCSPKQDMCRKGC